MVPRETFINKKLQEKYHKRDLEELKGIIYLFLFIIS